MYFSTKFFLPAFLFAVFLLPVITLAQSNAGITLIPAVIEEKADPGATFVRSLKITNESDVDKEFFIFKKNIKGVEAGGVPIFAENEEEMTGYEITEWIDIQEEVLNVPARGSVELPFTINVPVTATPGSHFGGLFVSAEPPKYRKIGAGVGYEVASILSIRIDGDIVDDARVRSFSTDKLLYGEKNVHFIAEVENQGNIMIRPHGHVTITNMFGSEPALVIVNEALAGVFPGTKRNFEFDWIEDGFGFGRYEAILGLVYDGEKGQNTIDATLIFWVFPMKVILTGFGILMIILVGGYLLTKYYVNQAILRAAGGRRIPPQRYRKQVGVSRFTFVFVSILVILALFLLVLLMFIA